MRAEPRRSTSPRSSLHASGQTFCRGITKSLCVQFRPHAGLQDGRAKTTSIDGDSNSAHYVSAITEHTGFGIGDVNLTATGARARNETDRIEITEAVWTARFIAPQPLSPTHTFLEKILYFRNRLYRAPAQSAPPPTGWGSRRTVHVSYERRHPSQELNSRSHLRRPTVVFRGLRTVYHGYMYFRLRSLI